MIEFWGGFWGGFFLFGLLYSTIFWYACIYKQNNDWPATLLPIVAIIVTVNLYGALHYGRPQRVKGIQIGREETQGIPIASNLESKTFTPLAFVITEHRILVYDKNEKVYALDGIKLDRDLTPETLTVGTNVSYTVFTKAGQLYFGRVEN